MTSNAEQEGELPQLFQQSMIEERSGVLRSAVGTALRRGDFARIVLLGKAQVKENLAHDSSREFLRDQVFQRGLRDRGGFDRRLTGHPELNGKEVCVILS
jgi:hypothetical protein